MKSKLFYLPFTVFLFSTLLTFAQIPPGYYDGTEGLTGTQLKAALHNKIGRAHV